MEELLQLIEDLALERPVFHSEADFQHSLAWKIRPNANDAGVRLEKPFQVEGNWWHLDIFVEDQQCRCGIELKYKKAGWQGEVEGEQFHLTQQGAYNHGRYDFLKDVSRLERLVNAQAIDKGFAVLLTNDLHYLDGQANRPTRDANFRLPTDRTIAEDSTLEWMPDNQGIKPGRQAPIVIHNQITLEWREYSQPVDGLCFKFLLVEV